MPYDKVYHTFSTGESSVYYVLYVRHCKLKLVLDVLQLLVDDRDRKPLLYVTPEGNLYVSSVKGGRVDEQPTNKILHSKNVHKLITFILYLNLSSKHNH